MKMNMYTDKTYTKEQKIFICLKGYVDDCSVPAYKDLLIKYDTEPIIRNMIDNLVEHNHNETYYRMKYFTSIGTPDEDLNKELYQMEREHYKQYAEVFWQCIIRNY